MKKKLVTLLLIGAGAAMLTGCGKKQVSDPSAMTEPMISEESVQATIKELNAIDEAAAQEKEEKEAEKQAVADSYQVFPKSPEWEGVELPEQPIQIDDVFMKMGLAGAEILDRLQKSSVDYEFKETAEMLVPAGEAKKIEVDRDGFLWFTLSAQNVWDEAKPLGELPVVQIKLQEQAMPYAYVLDGRSYEDLLSMTYADLKADPVLSRYMQDESSGSVMGEDEEYVDTILLKFNSYQSGDDRLIDGEWTGYTFNNAITYLFEVDANTQKTLKATTLPAAGYSWVEAAPTAINDMTDCTSEELELIKNEVMTSAQDWYDRTDGTITGYTITKGDPYTAMDSSETPTKDFNFVIAFPDGTYGTVELNQVYRKANGMLWYRDSTNLWDPTDSMEKINERYGNQPIIPFE